MRGFSLNPCSYLGGACSVVGNTIKFGAACSPVVMVINFDLCKDAAGDVAAAVASVIGSAIGEVQRLIIVKINESAINGAAMLAEFVLGDILAGDNPISSPRLDPNSRVGETTSVIARPNIDPGWFVEQASLMRNIGLYLIGPLMMLVIMQAIVKGSMFFLLRSVLILLPVAIIGSVVLVQMTDLMLAISDDMSKAIAGTVIDGPEFRENLATTLNSMNPGQLSFFGLMWIFVFIFGMVAIFVELLLRETGIYLAAFFLPLAFSALVWPATAKWARRLVEILLGLIFSKVFITAALSLGIAGMANTVGPTVEPPAGASEEQIALIANEAATTSIAAMTAVLILAAFAGAKIISIGPGVEGAAAGRVLDTRSAWGKGQALSAGTSTAKGKLAGAASKVRPTGAFKN